MINEETAFDEHDWEPDSKPRTGPARGEEQEIVETCTECGLTRTIVRFWDALYTLRNRVKDDYSPICPGDPDDEDGDEDPEPVGGLPGHRVRG